MSEHYEHLQKVLCHELELLDKKYATGEDMTEQDLKRADLLYHTLKSAATYHAMKDAETDFGGAAYRSDPRESYAQRRGPYLPREMSEGYAGWYPMDYVNPYYRTRY